MEKASKEDSQVLNLRIYQLRVQIMHNVDELVDTLLELEKNESQTELRIEVEDLLTRITPALWFHINNYRDKIKTVRARH